METKNDCFGEELLDEVKVELIIGPTGSGKTREVIRILQEAVTIYDEVILYTYDRFFEDPTNKFDQGFLKKAKRIVYRGFSEDLMKALEGEKLFEETYRIFDHFKTLKANREELNEINALKAKIESDLKRHYRKDKHEKSLVIIDDIPWDLMDQWFPKLMTEINQKRNHGIGKKLLANRYIFVGMPGIVDKVESPVPRFDRIITFNNKREKKIFKDLGHAYDFMEEPMYSRGLN